MVCRNLIGSFIFLFFNLKKAMQLYSRTFLRFLKIRHLKSKAVSSWSLRWRICFSVWLVGLVSKSCPTLVTPGTVVLQAPLCPWDSPGKNTGVGCCFLLQGIFPTQESNLGLLHCRQILYQLSYAAAAAKLLQSCPTLCDPIDGSPPGSSLHGILQARTLEWVAISFSNAGK